MVTTATPRLRERRAGLHPWLVVGCAGLLLAAACHAGTGPAAGRAAVPLTGDVFSSGQAKSKADALLDLVRVPQAAPLTKSPSSVLRVAAESPAGNHLVDHARWWTAPGRRDDVIAWFRSHPPAGLTQYIASTGGANGVATLGFSPDDPAARTSLLVSVVQDGARVDVRADGQVTWLHPKGGVENVPASVTTATFDYTGPSSNYRDDTTVKPARAHAIVTGAAQAQVIVDLNALVVGSDGPSSCTMDFGEKGRLAMDYSGHHVVFSVDFTGCYDVQVSSDGHAQHWLDTSVALTTDLYATIGVAVTPIPRVPAQGPPVTTAAPALTVFEHNKVQAERIGDAATNFGAPADAQLATQDGSPPRPAYTGRGTLVDRASFYTIPGKVADLVDWYRAHPASGTFAAEPTRGPDGLRILMMEPVDRGRQVKALVWVSMWQRGDRVAFRIDAQTAWLAR